MLSLSQDKGMFEISRVGLCGLPENQSRIYLFNGLSVEKMVLVVRDPDRNLHNSVKNEVPIFATDAR